MKIAFNRCVFGRAIKIESEGKTDMMANA